MAAGHFGQLDLVTHGELSFKFAREVAALARRTVEQQTTATTLAGTTIGNNTGVSKLSCANSLVANSDEESIFHRRTGDESERQQQQQQQQHQGPTVSFLDEVDTTIRNAVTPLPAQDINEEVRLWPAIDSCSRKIDILRTYV